MLIRHLTFNVCCFSFVFLSLSLCLFIYLCLISCISSVHKSIKTYDRKNVRHFILLIAKVISSMPIVIVIDTLVFAPSCLITYYIYIHTYVRMIQSPCVRSEPSKGIDTHICAGHSLITIMKS